jgi:hypothetical protein
LGKIILTMAVNQAQVDHIISTASADDPEVKLLKLQDEVELLKTSIKRLLIDIRERMNDMENPLNMSIQSSPPPSEHLKPIGEAKQDIPVPYQEHVEVAHHIQPPEPKVQTVPAPPVTPAAQPGQVHGGYNSQTAPPANTEDELIISAIKSQLAGMQGKIVPVQKETAEPGKVRLQKVYRLFEWTTKNVRKYGHDRIDLMLESYRAMGYITDDSAKLVRDIARLVPTTLGEIHEISADEYVSELYELNHILNPTDVTLDRDMIEVLMEKRGGRVRPAGDPERDGSPTGQESDSEYINSKDRI